MLLWNLVDLFNTEGGWLLQLFAVLVSTILFTHFLKIVLDKLHNISHRKNNIWREAFIGAAIRPINLYIWSLVITYTIDVVTDNFISLRFPDKIETVFYIFTTLCIIWYFFRVKRNIVTLALEKQRLDALKFDSRQIICFGKLATVVIVIMSILLLMEVSGINIKTVIAFGGVSGLAIAFASQEIIANIFGGLMIHTTNPFSIYDFINLPNSNIEGMVEGIGWYQTVLRSPEKRPIYVPNSIFTKSLVVNVSRMSHRKIKETISIRHEDIQVAPLIINDIQTYLRSNSGVDQTEKISVYIANIEAYFVSISVQAHSKIADENTFFKFRDDLFINVANIIKKHNAKIAIPIQGRA